MSPKTVPLTADALERLPARCRACLFWELGHARPDAFTDPPSGRGRRGHADELAGDVVVQKQAWCSAQEHERRPPGRVAMVDGEVAGFALFAPEGELAPRRPPVPSTSDDALQLAMLWVETQHRERGIGRVLVQAAIKEALRLDLAAVEVYGDRRYREQDCVLPTMWLLREGFGVHREHPRYPLLRLDVRRTLRWADSLEQALDEVRAHLPRHAPAPAPGGSRRYVLSTSGDDLPPLGPGSPTR